MSESSKYRYATAALGLLTIAGLLFFSQWFLMERMIYIDMAYHTFVIAQTKFFAIQNHRFGAAFSQVFPLVAIKLNLPLKSVLQLYSYSFYICYLIYFIIIVLVLRKEAMGIVLHLSLTLITRCSFYWAQSEFPQGLSFLILFLSVVLAYFSKDNITLTKVVAVWGMLVVVIFFHPLLVIPLIFSLIFSLIYFRISNRIDNRHTATLLVMGLFVILFKGIAFKTGNYESGKMNGLNNFVTLFPDYFTINSTHFFVGELVGNYFGFALLFIGISGFYLWNKYYTKLMWLVLSVFSYTLLINVCFPNLGKGTYLQNLHLPLTVFVALPFAFEILPITKVRYWFPVLLLFVVCRLAVIYNSHTQFSERFNYLKKLVALSHQYSGGKFWISDENIPSEYFDTWGLPYESLILSSIESPDSATTIALESNCGQNNILAESQSIFINPFWDNEIETLPADYFKLQSGKYRHISADGSPL